MLKKLSLYIRGSSLSKIPLINSKASRVLAGVAVTIFALLIIFLFTGRIFLELFQWLLLPFPEKWSFFKNKKK